MFKSATLKKFALLWVVFTITVGLFAGSIKTSMITVKGTVVKKSGKPISDASVVIGKKMTKTNSKGEFAINMQVMRSYKIIVKYKGYETVTVNKSLDKPNEKNFNIGSITLKKAKKIKYGSLEGKAIDKDGKPVPFANVVITKLMMGTQTNEKGYFNIPKIPIGIYKIKASQMGYISIIMKDVTIKKNKTTKITFTMEKSSPIAINGTKIVSAKDKKKNPKLEELKLVKERRSQSEKEMKKIKGLLKEGESAKDSDDDDEIEIADVSEKATSHGRGGRADETLYSVDGISVSDPVDKSLPSKYYVGEDLGAVVGSPKDKVTVSEYRKEEVKATNTSSGHGFKSIDKKKPSKTKLFIDGKTGYTSKPKKSGLKASFVDDNKQFNYFLHFLEKYKKRAKHFNLDINNRFIITFTDDSGNTLPDVSVSIYSTDKKLLRKGKTYSNGTFMFFPSSLSKKYTKFKLVAEYNQGEAKKTLDIQDSHNITIKIKNTSKKISKNPPLDILFVLDTTGSMGEEINRLINTIEIINMNLMEFSPKPDIRFGMVLFKDKQDGYVTKIVPFTNKLKEFTKTLSKVYASGGGDKPEDLQAALHDAVKNVEWRKNGVKAAFIITDAPPHLNYPDEKYRYTNAAKDAKKAGIKLFTIGTGGLDINGEYVLRQISQFTSANYIFLTYGEKGESEGGKVGSVSHHTGENFKTDKLEAIIIQLLKKELKLYTGKEIVTDEYIEANPITDEKSEETLDKLFSMALSQLYDYSSVKIEDNTPTAVSPFVITGNSQKATAEYFYQNMELALAKNRKFKAVERKDLQPILSELKFQLDDLSNQDNAAKLGKFMGAKLLITAKVFEKGDHYEVFLKLLNVETVEILSITKLKINRKLGL